MRKLMIFLIVVLNFSFVNSQDEKINQEKIKEDLKEMIQRISDNYVYLQEKKVDLNCLQAFYEKQIPKLQTEEDKVLFFEYLLDEFYDSHLILNTNRKSSFRLFSPIYATIKEGKIIIAHIWQTQLEPIDYNLTGAELIKINGVDCIEAIEQFPTHCNDKTSPPVKEWIINKLLAGRYNQARVLSLRLEDGQMIEFDLDQLRFKQTKGLLSSGIKNNIGIIRINNSLGTDELIDEFDKALDQLMETDGLIIDLRNTVDGGNSYVARGIMGRFLKQPKAYQKHWKIEQYGAQPKVERSWIEYVSPRGILYEKPLIILVGRWTGSMGEGLAIGFDGMERASIVGTEMERLAGEMNGFSFKYQNFGYRLSVAKLFHLDGTPREQYVPKNYVQQTTMEKDEVLEKGLELIKE